MTKIEITPAMKFQNFANALPAGWLKLWKAGGMMDTLRQLPEIMHDEIRFRNYIDNCLRMEGFREQDFSAIAEYLKQNVEK